jgi:hypothetical protein
MPKPLRANNIVRRSVSEIPPEPSAEELASVRRAMKRPINTLDIPEVNRFDARVQRDASGKLVRNPLGKLRRAILKRLDRLHMTRYRLWKRARAHQGSLTQSAVYEYLRGQRDIGTSSVEAMLEAVGLRVSAGKKRAAKSPRVKKPARIPRRSTTTR